MAVTALRPVGFLDDAAPSSGKRQATGDPIFVVEVGGIQYECREHSYSSNVLKLADSATITIPAPDGYVQSKAGPVSAATAAPRGALCMLYMSDPAVQGGALLPRIKGRVIRRNISGGGDGTVLRLTVADLGWHLTSCGRVFKNIWGASWETMLRSQVLDNALGWGFVGVRGTNLLSKRIKLGRQSIEAALTQKYNPKALVRLQIEVGQTLDSMFIEWARYGKLLLNVSTDGYLQFFKPACGSGTTPYSEKPLYTFIRRRAPNNQHNNIISATLDESAESYTHVECWSSVVDLQAAKDIQDKLKADPNAARYHGEFNPTKSQKPFDFYRSYTFTDPNQIGSQAVNDRAKWQWQRFEFDAWTYQVEVYGHSQGGSPFVEDTMCEVHDEIAGVDGVFYVAAVDCRRKLARAGFDKGAGTRATLTIKKPNLLAA